MFLYILSIVLSNSLTICFSLTLKHTNRSHSGKGTPGSVRVLLLIIYRSCKANRSASTRNPLSKTLLKVFREENNHFKLISYLHVQDAFEEREDQYLGEGDAYLLVYSVTNRRTFKKANELRFKLQRSKESETVPIILVGNKTDLERSREVSFAGKVLS